MAPASASDMTSQALCVAEEILTRADPFLATAHSSSAAVTPRHKIRGGSRLPRTSRASVLGAGQAQRLGPIKKGVGLSQLIDLRFHFVRGEVTAGKRGVSGPDKWLRQAGAIFAIAASASLR